MAKIPCEVLKGTDKNGKQYLYAGTKMSALNSISWDSATTKAAKALGVNVMNVRAAVSAFFDALSDEVAEGNRVSIQYANGSVGSAYPIVDYTLREGDKDGDGKTIPVTIDSVKNRVSQFSARLGIQVTPSFSQDFNKKCSFTLVDSDAKNGLKVGNKSTVVEDTTTEDSGNNRTEV